MHASYRFLVILALGLCFQLGCNRGQASEGFANRLAAAQSIGDQKQKDVSIAAVARDSAAAGNAEVVQQAIGQINDSQLRDSTAASCAHKLAKAGKHAEATTVARMIFDQKKQDATLSGLAKE